MNRIKKITFSIVLFFSCISAFGSNPATELRAIFESCAKIKSGNLTLHRKSRILGSETENNLAFRVEFNNHATEHDTEQQYLNTLIDQKPEFFHLFDGDSNYWFNAKDSVLEISDSRRANIIYYQFLFFDLQKSPNKILDQDRYQYEIKLGSQGNATIIIQEKKSAKLRDKQIELDFFELVYNTSTKIPLAFYQRFHLQDMVGSDSTWIENYNLSEIEDLTFIDKFWNLKLPIKCSKIIEGGICKYYSPLASGTKILGGSFQTTNGKELNLDSLKNKIILLDFWYKSCIYCLLSFSEINTLQTKYAPKGLLVLGVNSHDTIDLNGLSLFCRKRNVIFPTLIKAKSLTDFFKINGYPTYCLLDSEKRVIKVYEGYSTEVLDEITATIEAFLK